MLCSTIALWGKPWESLRQTYVTKWENPWKKPMVKAVKTIWIVSRMLLIMYQGGAVPRQQFSKRV